MVVLIISVAPAQETGKNASPADPMELESALPEITFTTDSRFLMRAFYPEYYSNEYKIINDVRWADKNGAPLIAMCDSLGDSILTTLQSLSGIRWRENEININLLRYLRVDVLYDPPAMALEGIKSEKYTELAPSGAYRLLNIIKLMAARNIMQLRLQESPNLSLADHPLLEESAYRFDVITLVLTVACAQRLLLPDELASILNSDQWRRRNLGWEIYNEHFRNKWILSPEQPLLSYLSDEPYNSSLVARTKPPRTVQISLGNEQSAQSFIPAGGGGKLGFSVIKTSSGFLEVLNVDTLGLAYAGGVRPRDKIRRVNGELVKNARQLMSKILDDLNLGGVYLIVLRDGKETGLLLLPPAEEH